MLREDHLRVSVIITNYNYAHFLGSCIDSALAQTCRVEVVVVDDGSTDGSIALARSYGDRITLVSKENGGQASAFNAGFAAATGDIIVFLDADDLLLEDAADVILAHWRVDTNWLAFGLELVGGDGSSHGPYPATLEVDDGDNLPRLLRRGFFAFSPTSGNAFSRKLLGTILPMPEAEWKISADAYLIRAAAVESPCVALRRVCGRYRIHGNNNYFRLAAGDTWFNRRSVDHMRKALAALRQRLAGTGVARPEAALLSASLWIAELRIIAMFSSIGDVHRIGAPTARRAALATAFSPLPAAIRLKAVLLLSLLATSWKAPLLRDLLLGRKAPAAWLISGDFQPFETIIQEALAKRREPICPEVPPGTSLHLAAPGLGRNIIASGYVDPPSDNVQWCCANACRLTFTLPPTPDGLIVRLTLRDSPEGVASGRRFEAFVDEIRVASAATAETVELVLELAPDQLPALGHALVITIKPASTRRSMRSVLSPAFALVSLEWIPPSKLAPTPLLVAGQSYPAARFVSSDLNGAGWTTTEEGELALAENGAPLTLFADPSRRHSQVALRLGGPVPAGILKIRSTTDTVDVFNTAALSGGDEIRIALGGPRVAEEQRLTFHFDPEMPGEQHPLRLRDVTLQSTDGHALGPATSIRLTLLNPGQIHFFAHRQDSLHQVGWAWDPESGLRNVGTEALLKFRIRTDLRSPAIVLGLSPDHLTPDETPIVGVSINGTMVRVCQLLGADRVEVPILPQCHSGDGEIVLCLHILSIGDASESDPPRRGSVILESLTLRAEEGEFRRAQLATTAPRSAAWTILARFAGSRRAEDLSLADLAAMRADLARSISHAPQAVLVSDVASPGFLKSLADLRRAAAIVPLAEEERALLAREIGEPVSMTRLRYLVCAMVLVPAWQAIRPEDIVAPPDHLLIAPDVYGAYLAGQPDFVVERHEVEALDRYNLMLIEGVERIMAEQAPSSRGHRLAVEILAHHFNMRTLFSDENLKPYKTRWARSLETVMHRQGYRIASPPAAPRPVGPIRVILLARSLAPGPEFHLLEATTEALAGSGFETIVALIDQKSGPIPPGPHKAAVLNLTSEDVSSCVGAIRGLEPHVVVLCSYFSGLERLSYVAAHRLAPVQCITTAVSPATSGLRSFTHVLSSEACEPVGAGAHYTERLKLSTTMIQAFAFDRRSFELREQAHSVRARHGIPEEAVMLMSCAVMFKLSPQLLETWRQILSACPDAVLVLLPFARNWGFAYEEATCRTFLRTALTGGDIDVSRVIILECQSSDEVRALLGAADVYVDGFPYSGATTVCEALMTGLPVVTLEGDSQRARQGAAWLRAFELPDWVASNPTSYRDLTVRLVQSPADRFELRMHIKERVLRADNPILPNEQYAGQLQGILRDTVRNLQHRLSDKPATTNPEKASVLDGASLGAEGAAQQTPVHVALASGVALSAVTQ